MKARKVGLIVLLVLLCVGGLAWWKTRAPQVGGVPFAQLSPAQQQERRQDAEKLETQVREIAQSARKKERKPFKITASEDQLNTLLQDRIRLEKAPIRDIKAGLQPDVLSVQGTVNYNGIDVVATLDGQIGVRDGKLSYEVDSLKLGGFNAPEKWKGRVEKVVAEKLNKAFADAPGRITRAQIEAGKLTIEGETA